ncbi:MAG: HAD-IG family 5'-nucleotidase [bacterium]|nr:HAD-IG family 5'-nucleotidase [bacterium]
MNEAQDDPKSIPIPRQVFASRTLNLRAIEAIGYDMDYTLVHYNVEAWERRAYDRLKELLTARGWPVQDLEFKPELVIRGLIIDTELGNVVKANRFGYVMHAFHGTRPIDFHQQREIYKHTPVDLGDPRFVFLNTLFSLSETCIYAQLVDLFDEGHIEGVQGYRHIYRTVQQLLDQTHVEGVIKADITANPERFVDRDPEAALALLDQHRAGKRLMLISNAEWSYVREIMAYAFDSFLPKGLTWRDLFELVIASARKPTFFEHPLPLFSIEDESGLLRPVAGGIPGPGLYVGGDATCVEEYLGLSGSQILYVGDHVYADVHISKSALRWRTALVLRELEEELEAQGAFRDAETKLARLMARKTELEQQHASKRLELQRARLSYGPQPAVAAETLENRMAEIWKQMEALDAKISPLARDAAVISNQAWGLLLRAGNDKSLLASQLERSADVYTSRVSNFLHATPFAYLRSTRGSMPHDPVYVLDPRERM